MSAFWNLLIMSFWTWDLIASSCLKILSTPTSVARFEEMTIIESLPFDIISITLHTLDLNCPALKSLCYVSQFFRFWTQPLLFRNFQSSLTKIKHQSGCKYLGMLQEIIDARSYGGTCLCLSYLCHDVIGNVVVIEIVGVPYIATELETSNTQLLTLSLRSLRLLAHIIHLAFQWFSILLAKRSLLHDLYIEESPLKNPPGHCNFIHPQIYWLDSYSEDGSLG